MDGLYSTYVTQDCILFISRITYQWNVCNKYINDIVKKDCLYSILYFKDDVSMDYIF